MGLRERLGNSASAFDEELPGRADCPILQCNDPDMYRPDWQIDW
jgi:hypothetical protein